MFACFPPKKICPFLFVACLCFQFGMVLSAAAAAVVWHHRASPYRAVFRVISRPTQERAGIALEVPTCGLGGDRAGGDFFAFTEHGRPLPLMTLGGGLRHHTLALVGAPEPASDIYLYFGSGAFAPQNRTFFRPGLLARVYSFKGGAIESWRQASRALSESDELGKYFAENIALSHNPIDSREHYAVEFKGYFIVPRSGEYTFTLASENAGYLLVNDRLLIARDGRPTVGDARRGEFNHRIDLFRGIHSIRCVVFNDGGRMFALVGRLTEGDGGGHQILPADFFMHSGRSELRAVGSRRRPPHPLFDYSIVSHIGYAEQHYHLVRFESLTGHPVSWDLDNGLRLHGESVYAVLPGLGNRYFSVRSEGLELAGVVRFPERAPPSHSIENPEQFERYAELMVVIPPARLDTATLLDYWQFMGRREAHPHLGKIVGELIQRPELSDRQRRSLRLHLARLGEGEQAAIAYRELQQSAGELTVPGEWEVGLEVLDFLIFRRGASKAAEELLQRLATFPAANEVVLQTRRIDLALSRNDVAEARRIYRRLTGTPEALRDQRLAQVRGNNLEELFYGHLREGLLSEAWEVLREWEAAAPHHRQAGSFQLARVRLFRQFGWRLAAMRVVQQAMQFNPQMSYLPELQLERWQVLRELHMHDEANRLRMQIIERYPRHPVADKLRDL